jgi:FkbM family methyltransferase
VLDRIRSHLRWRIDEALRLCGLSIVRSGVPVWRLHRAAPDDFKLRGVRLDLAATWVTPGLRAGIYDGNYEAFEAEIIDATMTSDDRVLEIGCGIGFIASLAARVVGDAVRCYDANPAIAAAARETIGRNGGTATVVTGVLQHNPEADATSFYVTENFTTSSLVPIPGATAVTVPVLDAATEIAVHRTSYLIVDIEGAETELLREPLPACVRKVCVECHPSVSRPEAMLGSLFDQGFTLSFEHSRPPVLYLSRVSAR